MFHCPNYYNSNKILKNYKLFSENGNVEKNSNNNNSAKESENIQETNESNENSENSKGKKKSKKRQHEENDNDEPSTKKKFESVDEDKSQEEIVTENGDSKFSWKSTILGIVTNKGEISMKKLKKKVIVQYLNSFPHATPEKAASKFEKKLGKISDILISDDKVRLVSS